MYLFSIRSSFSETQFFGTTCNLCFLLYTVLRYWKHPGKNIQMEPRHCKTKRMVQSVKYKKLCLKSCMWDHFMVVQAVLYDTTYFEYTGTPYQTLSIITLEDFHIPSETSGGNPVLWFTVRRLSSYSDVGNKEWTPLKKTKSCYGGRSPSYALWVSLSCRRKSWHVCKSGFHNDLIMGNCALLSFMRPSFSVQFYCFIFTLYCAKE